VVGVGEGLEDVAAAVVVVVAAGNVHLDVFVKLSNKTDSLQKEGETCVAKKVNSVVLRKSDEKIN
jgi:hypothetical protein